MATQNRTEAVDYRRVNAQYGSAAPRRQPKVEPRRSPKPQVVQKSRAQIRAEERRSTAKAIKLVSVFSILFALVAFHIYCQVQVDDLNRELSKVNSQIEIVESENTRLNMELDSIISLDKVDDYAQNVLGMVKVENYQVSYIDLSGGDTVTLSGGKEHTTFVEKVKSIMIDKK